MGIKRIVSASGQTRYVRARFDPHDYTVPSDVIPNLRADYQEWGSRELLAQYDGPFRGMAHVEEIQRAGRYFIRLLAFSLNFAIDIELTDNVLGEILPVPPEETWTIIRSYDAKNPTTIDAEDD
jgi:hypothetical protein